MYFIMKHMAYVLVGVEFLALDRKVAVLLSQEGAMDAPLSVHKGSSLRTTTSFSNMYAELHRVFFHHS